jgi:hypothetical protein
MAKTTEEMEAWLKKKRTGEMQAWIKKNNLRMFSGYMDKDLFERMKSLLDGRSQACALAQGVKLWCEKQERNIKGS